MDPSSLHLLWRFWPRKQEEQEALGKETNSSNNKVGEEDGEYQYEEDEDEMEIGADFEDLLSDVDDED